MKLINWPQPWGEGRKSKKGVASKRIWGSKNLLSSSRPKVFFESLKGFSQSDINLRSCDSGLGHEINEIIGQKISF